MQGSIDAGCTSYKTEIVSISCNEDYTSAKCKCIERRDGMEMTFDYDLEKFSGEWKITNYAKDFEDMEE